MIEQTIALIFPAKMESHYNSIIDVALFMNI